MEKAVHKLRFENDGTGRKEQAFRVLVQSENGVRNFGQMRFGYNSATEHLDIQYVRVTKPDGSVITAGPETVQELSVPINWIAPTYSDYREKHVTVPGLRPGDIVEADVVTTIQSPIAPGQFWTQYDFNTRAIVLDEQLEIDIPAGRTIKLKTSTGHDPQIAQENGRRVYHWSSSNLVREDEDKKDAKAKKKKHLEDAIPDVQLTTFESWEEVGKWYAALEKAQRAPSPAVQAKADELSKGQSTDLDKAQALYSYTAEDFRYVSISFGVGRFQPHSADQVLRNQYGDCKDKNTLLAALLESERMHSSTVLINSVRKLDPDVPSPAQFNHALTMLPVANREIWMDATTEVAPFGLISYALRDKQALLIPPTGPAHLVRTPADPPLSNYEKLRIEGKIDDSGTLDGKVAYEIRGDSEIALRSIFRNVPRAQWQKIIEDLASKAGLGTNASEIDISDPGNTRQPFTLSYRIKKPNFVDASKAKLSFVLPLRLTPLAAVDEDNPDDPTKLGALNENLYSLKLEIPGKYSVHAPVPSDSSRDYASYTATYKLEDNILAADRHFVLKSREIPASRVRDYAAFRRTVLADVAQPVSMETNSAGRTSSPADLTAKDLVKSGYAAIKDGNYQLAADSLKKATDLDPQNRFAWNDLGLAYYNLRRDDDAVATLKKAIEVNPYDQYAYNNLGRVYLRQRHYEEAAKWFEKQIEVAPLDKMANSNLGRAYLGEKQYDRAVTTLEKAASLAPNDSSVQLALGQAYLNSGQDQKATTAFDRAVSLSPRASVWNDVAYYLSLGNAHLDVALRYAETAVAATAPALRNISPTQPSRHDLSLVSDIAVYWDTLGYAEFAQGHLDKAERYVTAAWQLAQHSDIADHLGQIYEKRGDQDAAEKMYALALNAQSPLPESRPRLIALAGGDDNATAVVARYKSELARLRTYTIPNATKQDGKADFFVSLTNGKDSSAVTVESVTLIGNNENFQRFAEPLHALKYDQALPDDATIRLVRRGTLTCSASSPNCDFVLALPSEIRAND